MPKDVFFRSNENSYKTVLAIKDMFKDDVTLHFVDKRDNQIYNNSLKIFFQGKTKIMLFNNRK